MSDSHYDLVAIGSGPAGQKAAIEAAKNGLRAAVIEQSRDLGGMCVYRGTIPSKTLRETSVQLKRARRLLGEFMDLELRQDIEVQMLMARLHEVTDANGLYTAKQFARHGVEAVHGRASFIGPNTIEVLDVSGERRTVTAEHVVIATGSVPRRPPEVPIDHEHILDSDSILSLIYLPRSLVVLGAGVIATEYATIFAELDVDVTIIDRGDRPLSFMDEELSYAMVDAMNAQGITYLPKRNIKSVCWNGEAVETVLASGEVIHADKMLCALGRIANVSRLNLGALEVELTRRGQIPVDENFETVCKGHYAVGDVIGFPALAASSMEQGRRAARHAMKLHVPAVPISELPIGIYTIPEMSSTGLTEAQVIERHGECLVGRSSYDEVARGQIMGETSGLLKIVSDPAGELVLGVHIIGAGATELIHIGQMAVQAGWSPNHFVENIFNFPTLAEAYRNAAVDLLDQRAAK